MDAQQIRTLRPMLEEYLSEFDGCFGRSEPAGHMRVYVNGQLSDLPSKSIEPIADRGGVPPRTLQQFLSRSAWDHAQMEDHVVEIVVRDHADSQSIGVIDETSDPKKGTKTPGVRRQYCGATGKVENCVVTVHLSYVAGDFHTLLSGELFLPQEWSEDRARCREAGIPDAMVHRPKWEIALDLRDRAVAHGVRFAWVTGDEGYGEVPAFHFALDDRGQRYVLEIPRTFHVWARRPHVLRHPRGTRRRRGRAPRFPRVARHDLPTLEVQNLVRYGAAFRAQRWVRFHVKDSTTGPVVWAVKAGEVSLKRDGLPTEARWLIVARNVLDPKEVKYFASNAPAGTPLEALLHVAFQRFHVERCFEEEKGELGMDQSEVRNYPSLKRHWILSAVSHLFLARVRHAWRGEKSAPDDLPVAPGGECVHPIAVADGPGADGVPPAGGRDHHRDPAPEREVRTQPCESPQTAVA
jgi:SRSO17 transposase